MISTLLVALFSLSAHAGVTVDLSGNSTPAPACNAGGVSLESLPPCENVGGVTVTTSSSTTTTTCLTCGDGASKRRDMALWEYFHMAEKLSVQMDNRQNVRLIDLESRTDILEDRADQTEEELDSVEDTLYGAHHDSNGDVVTTRPRSESVVGRLDRKLEGHFYLTGIGSVGQPVITTSDEVKAGTFSGGLGLTGALESGRFSGVFTGALLGESVGRSFEVTVAPRYSIAGIVPIGPIVGFHGSGVGLTQSLASFGFVGLEAGVKVTDWLEIDVYGGPGLVSYVPELNGKEDTKWTGRSGLVANLLVF